MVVDEDLHYESDEEHVKARQKEKPVGPPMIIEAPLRPPPADPTKYESNARFVRWSDGSLQLLIGNEVLDISVQDAQHDQTHLFVRHGKFGTSVCSALVEVQRIPWTSSLRYTFLTNIKVKFIVVTTDLDVRDADVRNFFRRFHAAYVDAVSNPFHVPGKKIT